MTSKTQFLLYTNSKTKNSNIIEIFGLPKSGKTTILKRLKQQGKRVYLSDYQINPHNPLDTTVFKAESRMKKLNNFIRFVLRFPFKTVLLYSFLNSNWITQENLSFREYLKIFAMRNSYVAAMMAKWVRVQGEEQIMYTDEFILQSLFMIQQKKAQGPRLAAIVRTLPAPSRILLIEVDETERERRSRKSLSEGPTKVLRETYFSAWRKNQAYNYSAIKNILTTSFGNPLKIKNINVLPPSF